MTKNELKSLHECLNEPLNGSNLRTLFLLLTRVHYSDPKNYGYLEEQLKCFWYDSDKMKATLQVELSQEYDLNKDNRRPAVYVGLDRPFEFKKIDIGHKQSSLDDNSASNLGNVVTTSVALIHVAETMDQALLLADSSASFLIGIGEVLRQKLNLASFEAVSISPPAMLEPAPERFFRVDVIFGLSFSYSVRANIESHRLKKFAMEFIAE